MPEVETATVTAATSAGTAAMFKAALERLEKTLKGPAKALGIKALASIRGYAPYTEETHERVSTFKTFADPTKPVSLLDHFVEARFCLTRSSRPFNQDSLLKKALKPSRIVISATAGFGKGMVMRYLALAMFENPAGKIPIFLELRNLNRVTAPDIISYINSSYRQNSPVQAKTFTQALASGAIVLLLDGFDELNHDIREHIEDQILELSRRYPLATIVISGRPDDRFKSWKSFTIYKVQPMAQAQVIQLINKLDYDKGVGKRFVQKIKEGLYKSHESFMSTPLLAILMLLTFEQNANIPDKMHLFYSEAFRTLFHKHDALKEQYDRSRKSGLAVDHFEKVFSVLCLKTYVLEKLEFTEREIIAHIKDALAYEEIDRNPEDFLFDIEEAICLFVKEGNSYFFIHRSFQEYFTALFLSSCQEAVRDEFIDQVATRYWDNVLPMLFDMASDQIIPTWVAPRCTEYLEKVGDEPGQLSPLLARWDAITLFLSDGSYVLSTFTFGPFWQFVAVMLRFYPSTNQNTPLSFSVIEQWAANNGKNVAILDTRADRDTSYLNISFIDLPPEIITSSGLEKMARLEYEQITKINSSINRDQKVKGAFLDKLFSKKNRS